MGRAQLADSNIGSRQCKSILCDDQEDGTIKDSSHEEPSESLPIFCSYRLLVTVICQLGIVCNFSSQSIIAASFLTMIRHSHVDAIAHNSSDVIDGRWSEVRAGVMGDVMVGDLNGVINQSQDSVSKRGVSVVAHLDSDDKWHYNWDKTTQGWILFAYFIGYYIMQIPAACLTHEYGGKRVTVCGAIFLSILQGLAVVSARFGVGFFLTAMALSGAANGCIYVPIVDVLGKWVPPLESSILVNIAMSGLGFGIGLVYGLSAVTDRMQLWGGWPFNFLVLGGLLLMLALLVSIVVTDSPAQNAYITHRERVYIMQTQSSGCEALLPKEIPWRSILTSGPVYAIAASQLGTDGIIYFCVNVFPVYLCHTRHMDTGQVDMLTGLSWLLYPGCGYLMSLAVDTVRQRRWLSTTVLRKSIDAAAKILPMSLLLLIVHLPQEVDSGTVVALYVATVAMTSWEGSTWQANIVDISARYSGLVSSIAQAISLPVSFCLPPLVAALTLHNSEEEWQRCLLGSLITVIITYLMYLYWGSSESQHWELDTETQLSE